MTYDAAMYVQCLRSVVYIQLLPEANALPRLGGSALEMSYFIIAPWHTPLKRLVCREKSYHKPECAGMCFD